MKNTHIPDRAAPGTPFATAPSQMGRKIAWPGGPSILRRHVSATCLVPWILVALASLDLKYKMMATGGFTVAARSLGRNVTVGAAFTFWEKLSFFRMDLLMAVIGVVALDLIASYLPNRWRLRVVGVPERSAGDGTLRAGSRLAGGGAIHYVSDVFGGHQLGSA